MKLANVSVNSIEDEIRRSFLSYRALGSKKGYPKNLKNLCVRALQAGLTHSDVADCAAVTQRTIYNWEKAGVSKRRNTTIPIDIARPIQILDVIKPPVSPSGSISIAIGDIKIEILARSER